MGGGKSGVTTKRHWNIKTLVRELDYLVKAWGIKEFHLAGISWGGTLALEYYLFKKGKGIRSLMLTSPMFSAAHWKADATKLIRKLPCETQKVIKYCHEIGATDSKVYQRAMKTYYLKHVLRDEKKLNAGIKKSMHDKSSGKLIYQYMCGEFDEATPSTIARYSRMVKNSKFKMLKGCSHASTAENPKMVLTALAEFLTSADI